MFCLVWFDDPGHAEPPYASRWLPDWRIRGLELYERLMVSDERAPEGQTCNALGRRRCRSRQMKQQVSRLLIAVG